MKKEKYLLQLSTHSTVYTVKLFVRHKVIFPPRLADSGAAFFSPFLQEEELKKNGGQTWKYIKNRTELLRR